jgi:acetyltransferase-like isoleucine patch superfamily enzyme
VNNSKKKILLYGGGAHAYVVENAIKNYNCRTGNYIINKKFFVSYIYDDFLKKPFYITKAKFLNKEIELKKNEKNIDAFIVCIVGMHGSKRHSISLKLERIAKPLEFLHQNCFIATNAKRGKGNQIMNFAGLEEGCEIGNYNVINNYASVGHFAKVGNGTHFMLGAKVAMGATIEDYVTLCANSIVIPGIKVGMGAIVGAGAVVIKDVPPFTIVAGNPATFIKKVKK